MGRFEDALGKWAVRNRWVIIAATVIIAFTAASGVRLLTFNRDNRVFFSEENPQLQALEELDNTYSKKNSVFFVVAPLNRDVFTREALAAIEYLTERSWRIPYSSRVNSITNFQHTYAEHDDLIVEDLVQDASSMSDRDLERTREVALNEPMLVNRLVSPSGHVAGVNINIILPEKSIEEVSEVSEFSRELADDFRGRYPDIDLYLTGGVLLDNAFGEASEDDLKTLVPLMFLLLILIMGVLLRSLSGTFSTMLIITVSMLTGMGLAGWLGITLNSASVNAAVIILTLAVADSIHILTTMFQHMRKGKTKHDAITESLRVNLQPVFLTSITTAIGFLTMNFSDAPPFRELGNIVAIGVMAAFIYSMLLLPSLMAVLPVRVSQKADKDIACRSCDRLAGFVIRRSTLIFWGTLVLMAFMTAGITQIELNDDFIKYFSQRYEVRRAIDFAEENLTGFNIIEYSLESGEPGGINDPAYLSKIDEFADWYRTQPKVVHVSTIADTIKRLNQNMHNNDKEYYRIPKTRELAAQYLLLYEMSLPFGLDLNDRVNVARSTARMTVTIKDVSAKELRELDEKARQWLKKNAPESMFTFGSGLSIIWSHLSIRNIQSMLGASFGALMLISCILIFALKSVRLGILSLVPNLSPAFMAFGIWGIFVGRVGLALSVIAAVTLGIVVDDTVHFMSKYLRARREHKLDPQAAVRYSFNTVGTAMIYSTLILVVGFSVLLFSGYRLSSEMGLLTAITITIALVMDFFFLPVLLMKADRKQVRHDDRSIGG